MNAAQGSNPSPDCCARDDEDEDSFNRPHTDTDHDDENEEEEGTEYSVEEHQETETDDFIDKALIRHSGMSPSRKADRRLSAEDPVHFTSPSSALPCSAAAAASSIAKGVSSTLSRCLPSSSRSMHHSHSFTASTSASCVGIPQLTRTCYLSTTIMNRPLVSSQSEGDLDSRSELDYDCWTETQVMQEMQHMIAEVASLVGMDEVDDTTTENNCQSTDMRSFSQSEKVAVLLRRYHWKHEQLIADFIESRERVLERCGLSVDISEEISLFSRVDHIDCMICDDSIPINEAYYVHPKHRFCQDCWQSYLISLVRDGRACVDAHCPGYQCYQTVGDSIFARFLSPNDFRRQQVFVMKAYVEDNNAVRWCTYAGCTLAIRARNRSVRGVECSNGHMFCFACQEDDHDPCTCRQYSSWLCKNRLESDNAHWIIANTKRCPTCSVRIEKNQGCNHMKCNNCKYEFCWVCHGNWKEHGQQTGGFYKCNNYDPGSISTKKWKIEEGASMPSAQVAASAVNSGSVSNTKAGTDNSKEYKNVKVKHAKSEEEVELNRYLFYYQRFDNHSQASRFAHEHQINTETKMAQLAAFDATAAHIEFSFLQAATTAILKCRHTLKYTYVYGYHLTAPGLVCDPSNQRERSLFEFLQQQLEQSVETLSELTEQPISRLRDAEEKSKILNFTRVTLRFREKLLIGLMSGGLT